MKHLILSLCLIGSFSALSQNTIRVTNGQNLQTVIDNATAGDIIIVEAGVYGSINVNKKLDLYGTGYFLNNGNTAYLGTSTIGNVNFVAGSELSTFQGFILHEINIGANGVVVSRNKVNHHLRIGHNGGTPVFAINILVKQNLVLNGIYTYYTSHSFVVKNNIVWARLYCDTPGFGTVTNNTCIGGNMELVAASPNVQYKNNIFTPVSIGGTIPFIVENNVSTNPTGNLLPSSNLSGVDINSLFLAYPNNPNNLQEDARYQLSPNSPAKGAGEGGKDAGAFGGDEPYVLSGIPSIPSIYQLTVPSQVQQGGTLNVQIKAKVNN